MRLQADFNGKPAIDHCVRNDLKMTTQDDNNTHFTLCEFKKVAAKHRSDKEWEKVVAKGSLLKPCEYKRR